MKRGRNADGKRPHNLSDVLPTCLFTVRLPPGDRPGADERIAALPLPVNDPLGGPVGPMVRLWRDGRLE